MSMETKFRAFDKFNEDMFYSGERLSEFFRDVERRIKGGNHVEVIQYTGIKDQNGKEIYEGDVMRWDEKEWGGPYSEVVEWSFELLDSRRNDWPQWCHVIGNIHENPELLKDKS